MKTQIVRRLLTSALAVCLLGATPLTAQDVKVMTSGAFASAYKELTPQFERTTGLHVETVWGPSMGTTPGAIPVRLANGETADVVIMARGALDALAKKGQVVSGSEVDLVRSKIGMAVRAGAQVPDIRTVEGFKQALLQARSVAYSDSASGEYIANELYSRLGIEKEMAAKSRKIAAQPVGEIVAKGEAELGFQQLSELQPVAGITVVGPIPDEIQKVTLFSAGLVAKATSRDNGRALIRYLASKEVCKVIEAKALEPIACAGAHVAAEAPKPVNPQWPNPYGESISVENAKKAAFAAVAEAKKNGWKMAVAITDVGGELAYFEKVEGTQIASSQIAIDKARSSVLFKRPTKSLEESLTAGFDGLRFLALRGAVPVEGGIPLLVDGKIVGGIGVSGGTNHQDGQCAGTGAGALK
jgi:molybdate transport system substrate-binding protein